MLLKLDGYYNIHCHAWSNNLRSKNHYSKQALTAVSLSLKLTASEQEDADEEAKEEVGHSGLESFFYV